MRRRVLAATVFVGMSSTLAFAESQEFHVVVHSVAVNEALRAVTYPGVQSVQIIFNAFRQKPAEQVLPAAARAGDDSLRAALASRLHQYRRP